MDALPFLITEIVAISAGVTWALIPLIKRLAWRCEAVACPDAVRRHHARPTALWGGVGLFVGVSVAVVVACAVPSNGVGRCAGSLRSGGKRILAIGIRDDIKPLSARFKLLCQIGVARLIVGNGFYPKGLSLLGHHVHLEWFGAVCMIGWLVLGINAVNLIDGMDGLASVIGIVVSTAIAVIAGVHNELPSPGLGLGAGGGIGGFPGPQSAASRRFFSVTRAAR